MPYAAKVSDRQRQLSTSLSTNTPSQSKMMRSGLIIVRLPSLIRAYTQTLGNNPQFAPSLCTTFPAPQVMNRWRVRCDKRPLCYEPASDIDTAWMDSLKVLDPEGPIREADIA